MEYSALQHQSALLATLGSEPQVVTAAYDLLTRQGETVSRVEVVHTQAADPPLRRAVETVRAAFSNPPYTNQTSLALHPLRTPDGRQAADAATPAETQAVFSTVYNLVRHLKRSGCRVHLSIAGGRKTMAVFAMLAAQLLFDDHDRLWYLVSQGDFLTSKRLHPTARDQVQLVPVAVLQWSKVAPMLLDFGEIEDPLQALSLQEALKLRERLEDMRAFVLGALSPAEERVVAALVQTGGSDHELAESLCLSPRTVEEHLRAAYRKAADHWGLAIPGRAQLVALLNLYYSTRITGNPA